MQEVLCNEAESVMQNLLPSAEHTDYLCALHWVEDLIPKRVEKIQPGTAFKLVLHNVIFFYSLGGGAFVCAKHTKHLHITCVLQWIQKRFCTRCCYIICKEERISHSPECYTKFLAHTSIYTNNTVSTQCYAYNMIQVARGVYCNTKEIVLCITQSM